MRITWWQRIIWNPVGWTTTEDAISLTPGIYTVTITDAGSCSSVRYIHNLTLFS
jgi:hypothetical protein